MAGDEGLRVGRSTPQPVAERLGALAVKAVAEGELLPTVSVPQIRAYFRTRDIACTPLQARVVHDILGATLKKGRVVRRGGGQTFGARLAEVRKQRLLSRAELAQMVGCSESYLSYLETGGRSPSLRMLQALADVLGREPEWFRFGRISEATERISAELKRATKALESGDFAEACRDVDDLLSGEFGRGLSQDERDRALLIKGEALTRIDRDSEAARLLVPLVQRLVEGDCALPPVKLGQTYLSAVYFGKASGRADVGDLADAVARSRRVLAIMPRDERDDAWWRLAATVIAAEGDLGHVLEAISTAETWLGELDAEVSRVPSGVAALRWNLGIALSRLGRLTEAVEQLEIAVRLHDVKRYPCDGARLRVAYAITLMVGYPDRVGQAIEILDAVLPDLKRHAYPSDLMQWHVYRAQAEAIAGRYAEARALLAPLREVTGGDQVERQRMWLVLGDAHAGVGEFDEARAAYERAADVIERLPAGYRKGRFWRDVADRFRRVGCADQAMEAYSRALTEVRLVELPEVSVLDRRSQ